MPPWVGKMKFLFFASLAVAMEMLNVGNQQQQIVNRETLIVGSVPTLLSALDQQPGQVRIAGPNDPVLVNGFVVRGNAPIVLAVMDHTKQETDQIPHIKCACCHECEDEDFESSSGSSSSSCSSDCEDCLVQEQQQQQQQNIASSEEEIVIGELTNEINLASSDHETN